MAAHGATLADLINVRTFIADLDLLPEYGRARRAALKGERPTSTTVEVSRLFMEGALLEVEVLAACPS